MDNLQRDRGHLQLMVVLLIAIHSLLDLTISFLNRREIFLREALSEEGGYERPNAYLRRSRAWLRNLQQQVLACRIFISSVVDLPIQRTIDCPWYIKPRATEWCYLFVDWTPEEDPVRFREFFRITPAMFKEVCDLVREDMSTAPPQKFLSLPNRLLVVERQVAVALRRLATGDQMLGIAELFGISKQSASKCTWKFIQSFSQRGRRYLSWPDQEQLEAVKLGFKDRWGFPNCCGAIDATHFPIELPVGENATAYYDWKHNLSVTMQAVVDSRCRFLDVFIGSPGSIQDSRLLRTSGLFRNVVYDASKLGGPEYVGERGGRIPEYLLGDAGYPLYRWLIVPFTKGQSAETDQWNHWHSSARMCVERSFGRLKGSWRLLSRVILRPKVERLASTILTCVLLHNMAIIRGDDEQRVPWADFPAHPPGYGPFERPTNQFFKGGPEARVALLQEIRMD